IALAQPNTAALALANLVQAGAVRDRVDPGDRIGAEHVARTCFVNLEEGELQGVLGSRPVAQQPGEVSEDARREKSVQTMEGRGVAATVAGHDLGRFPRL